MTPGFFTLKFLTFFVICLSCMAPEKPEKAPLSAGDGMHFGGSCQLSENVCLQAYGSDPAAAATQILFTARAMNCTIQGQKKPCSRSRSISICKFKAIHPEGSPPGTMVRNDLFYYIQPDAEAISICNRNGQYSKLR